MALVDVNFSEGEGQDFIVEVPAGSYVGSLADAVYTSDDAQYPVLEVPAQEGEGGNVFIITE